ncbi:MAG: hypothetical protein M3Q23_17440 [Actinomycetota bacterium]|nr:hypothetical protein [Actinomycetota bacterium]
MDEQSESKWLDLSGVDSELGENSHGDPEGIGGAQDQPSADALPASRPMPSELVQRVADTANMIELLMRDLWTQAEQESESIRDSARRQADNILADAQRAARRTLEQARDRAEVIVGAAKMEATKVAGDAERLAREFLGRLSSLVTPSEMGSGAETSPEAPERPNSY